MQSNGSVLMVTGRWWGWLDLNQRPSGYEPPALTPELHPRGVAENGATNRSEYSRFGESYIM
jgi:hypothetical protein